MASGTKKWTRTPQQDRFLESFVDEYLAKYCDTDEDHVAYVKNTLLPLWDKDFGQPAGLDNFPSRFHKYYRNKHQRLKKGVADSAPATKKRSRAVSAINLFAESNGDEILHESKSREEGKWQIARWQEVRNEKWLALTDQEKAVWVKEAEKRKQDENERRAAGPTESDIEESIKALKKIIPKMLAKLVCDLPEWSVDLKLGGPSPDGSKMLYRQYGHTFQGGLTYKTWCDIGKSQTSSDKMDKHFISYLQHQLTSATARPGDDDQYPVLAAHEDSWTLLTTKTYLEQFFVKTWDRINGEKPIPWVEIVMKPTLYFSQEALPPGFEFKQVANYDFVETAMLYRHLYVAQEGQTRSGVRFAWYPFTSKQTSQAQNTQPLRRTVVLATKPKARPNTDTNGSSGSESELTTKSTGKQVKFVDLKCDTTTDDEDYSGLDTDVGTDTDSTEADSEIVDGRRFDELSFNRTTDDKDYSVTSDDNSTGDDGSSGNEGTLESTASGDLELLTIHIPKSSEPSKSDGHKILEEIDVSVPSHIAFRPSWAAMIPKPNRNEVQKVLQGNTLAIWPMIRPLQAVVTASESFKFLVWSCVLLEPQVPAGTLPTLSLPERPAAWIQVAEDHLRQKQQVPAKFASEWRDWWTSLQPSFRSVEASVVKVADDLTHPPLSTHDQWKLLMIGGTQGLFQVIYTLGLCCRNETNSTGMTEQDWTRWVYDMRWALSSMLNSLVSVLSPSTPSSHVSATHEDANPTVRIDSPSPPERIHSQKRKLTPEPAIRYSHRLRGDERTMSKRIEDITQKKTPALLSKEAQKHADDEEKKQKRRRH